MSIEERFAEIRERVEAAAERSGRLGSSVRVVAVSKYRTVEEIEEALDAGVEEIGENRVQEAEHKYPLLQGRQMTWHLVGHLQSNKAKRAVQMFAWIHSVDSHKLAERIDRLAKEIGKRQRVLVQVDLAGEETKAGLPAAQLFEALEKMGRLEHLSVEGLMVLPPYLSDPEDVRPFFSRLRALRDEAVERNLLGSRLEELSMGMTHDFEVAIEEGATMVRIGTAIFGERPSSQPTLTKSETVSQEEGQ
jgi:pyridoxal phosphate enzyme (YggS family)